MCDPTYFFNSRTPIVTVVDRNLFRVVDVKVRVAVVVRVAAEVPTINRRMEDDARVNGELVM